MVKRSGRWLVGWGVGLAGLGSLVTVACTSVLGIESAALEPTTPIADAGSHVATVDASPQCQSYCAAVVQNCATLEYNDVPTCLTMCGAYDLGQPTDTTQDSIGCRAHYAQLAATDKSNCPAAGPLGGGVCGNDLCETFCTVDTYACTGANLPYDGGVIPCESTCQSNFNVYFTDAGSDLALSTGNSLNCRIWHLQAAVDPATTPGSLVEHCPHTALVSSFCH